jgi:hypothetical protein
LKEGGLASMLHFPINGHTVPAIEAFEKLASGLEVPLYQLFYKGEEISGNSRRQTAR